MEFVQLGQLELPSLATREFAELCGFFGASIHLGPSQKWILVPVAKELASHNAEVEVDVMAHEILGFLGGLQELVEDLTEGQTVFGGVFRGDAVYHLGIDGNDKTVRLDQQVVVFHQPAFVIVQLPSQLDQSWPVVEVGQRSVIIFRETRGLGIEDKKHVFQEVRRQKSEVRRLHFSGFKDKKFLRLGQSLNSFFLENF